MAVFKKIYQQLLRHDVLWRHLLILGLLVIVYLVYGLAPVYSTFFAKIKAVLKPFVIGFMIAYILNPLVEILEGWKVKRYLAMAIVYVAFIFAMLFLVGVLLPAILANVSKITNALITAVELIQKELFIEHSIDARELTAALVASVTQVSENLSIVENTINAFNEAFSYLTSTIIYLVISSYMLASFDRIKVIMKRFAKNIHSYLPSYLASLDFYMQAFLKGMATLMVIRLLEYGFMYFIIGHEYWKEMAVLSAVCVFVPYIGSLFSCVIGILTSFGLSSIQFVVMVLLIIVLFFVDSYIILPEVYSKEISSHPIWILFAMITGLNIFGLTGVLLSIPIFIALRVAYLEYIFFKQESV